jgi:DNA replication protein DnaC
MNENTYTKGDKCEHCGEDIYYGRSEFLNQEFRIDCECVVKKREEERQYKIERGKTILRRKMREKCGLKKRHIEMTLNALTPMSEQSVALKIYREVNSFMLSGGVGTGKTHIAAALANSKIDNYVISDDAALRAESSEHFYCPAILQFISFTELLSHIRQSYEEKSDSAAEVIKKYKNTPLLILDDLGAEKTTEWAQSTLFEIIDHRYNEFLPLVITTNLTVKEISEKLGSRTADRLRAFCKLVTISIKSQRKTAQ